MESDSTLNEKVLKNLFENNFSNFIKNASESFWVILHGFQVAQASGVHLSFPFMNALSSLINSVSQWELGLHSLI